MELLIKPEVFQLEEERLAEEGIRYAKYVLYPLEKGYAITIGNALRRVLLSSIPAVAITSIRIPSKLHEFDTIEGVKEDILEIALNLKKVQLKVDDLKKLNSIEGELHLRINKQGPSDITAGDIEVPSEISIANPDFKIATINGKNKVEIELFAQIGKGFVPASEMEHENDIEFIYIDGVFSPVLKVNYLTENIRVGKRTDYDKLILEIWTKMNITPEQALKEATSILIQHFRFINPSEDLAVSAGFASQPPVQDTGAKTKGVEQSSDEEDIFGLSREILDTLIDNLDLTKRAKNCLKRERINTVAEILKKTPEELMKIKNFGKKSLDEIRKELKDKFGIDYEKLFGERRSTKS
jgi:DNA-directed RNA polymerase subunit alpha